MIDNRWEPDEIGAYPYIECGAWGHAWTDAEPPEGRTAFAGVLVTVRCVRCEGWRFDAVRIEAWSRISRAYDMPEDYSFVKGGRPRRIDFQVALIKRRQTAAKNRRSIRPAQPTPA
jgi:hypothetical protein